MGAVPLNVLRRHRASVLIGAGTTLVTALIVAPTSAAAVPSTPRPTTVAAIPGGVGSVIAPGAPFHVVATPGDAQVRLTWSPPAHDGGAPITNYTVRYSSDGGSSWSGGLNVNDTAVTIKNLQNGTAYVFEVRASNDTASSPYTDPTNPVTPQSQGSSKDTVSIAAPKSASVAFGNSATLSTTLTDTTTSAPVPSATVTLLAKAAGAASFVEVGTDQTTNANGTAQVTVKPQVTTDYRWSYDGDGSHNGDTSSVGTLEVDQIVHAHLAATSVPRGQHADVYGTVAPSSVGEKVTLQQRHGGSWQSVAHGKIAVRKLPDGTHRAGFVVRVSSDAKGKQILRIRSHDTHDTAGGVSKRLKLTVT